MGDFYNDRDIVKHCTSTEQRFKLWRAHVQPHTQGQGFFWSDLGHDDLTTTIAQVKALVNTRLQSAASRSDIGLPIDSIS